MYTENHLFSWSSRFSRSERTLQPYGLSLEFAPPDGSCLFHTFSYLEPIRSMQEWRNRLCDRMEQKAADHGFDLLNRGNDALEYILAAQEKQPYTSLESLMSDMRGTQWGWSDFIQEFAEDMEAEVYCFTPDREPSYYRPKPEVSVIKRTHFMINETNRAGVYVGYVVYALYTLVYALYTNT